MKIGNNIPEPPAPPGIRPDELRAAGLAKPSYEQGIGAGNHVFQLKTGLANLFYLFY